MKNKRKIASLFSCLLLLSSCVKKVDDSSNCPITNSTPITPITPDNPDVEQINPFDYAVTYTNIGSDMTLKGSLSISRFSNDLTSEMREKITEIAFPETIDGVKLASISSSAIFDGFTNLKRIFIPKTISWIYSTDVTPSNSIIYKLPNIESIKVDENNEYYYTKGNCLIQRGYDLDRYGNRDFNDKYLVLCGWKDVEIPDEVTALQDYTFSSNYSISSIKLNPNITSISSNALKFISNMEKAIDLNGNTNFISENNCLLDSNRTTLYHASGDIIYPNFTTFSLVGFSNVTSVVIPNSVTDFATNPVAGTKIKSIHIPASVTSFGEYPNQFANNSYYIETVTIDENNPKYAASGNCIYDKTNNTFVDGVGECVIPENITALSSSTFTNHYSLKSITIPKTMKSIHEYFIGGCNKGREIKDYVKIIVDEDNPVIKWESNCLVQISGSTKTVKIAYPDLDGNVISPSTATSFNAIINYNCNDKHIKSITFNEGLKSIYIMGFSMFGGENQVSNIELPSTIQTIYMNPNNGASPFYNIKTLKSLSINGGDNDYFRIQGNCLIRKPTSTNTKEEIIFGWGDVVIPETITELGDKTFYNNESITSITIHKKLTVVGQNTFIFRINVATTNVKVINYKGTLEEFKANIGTTSYSVFSLVKRYKDVVVNYLDENGNTISKVMSEIE